MQGQNKERWQELCALAVKEQDPEKLVELTGVGKLKKKKGGQHQPELPQLGRRSVDHCDVFPVALRVEAIYLNRLRSMKLMFRAAIGTAHWINGRSYRPGPSKQQLCSARANSPLSALELASGSLRFVRECSGRESSRGLLYLFSINGLPSSRQVLSGRP